MPESNRERQQRERGQSGVEVPGNPKVSMVIACYKDYNKVLIPLSSLINQTYKNWEVIIIHDGPDGRERVRDAVMYLTDLYPAHLKFFHLPEKSNDWGNSSKEYGSKLATGDYIGHSNDDNFYAPVYLEWMLLAMHNNQAQLAYCNMIHSHRQYQPMVCEPRACHIDGGGWLASAEIVKSTPWPEPKSDGHADGHYLESLVSRCQKVIHVPGYLFTHN